MVMNQASARQKLFSRLAEQAHDQIPGSDANVRTAARAQSQLRANLETLATIENRPFIYARRANIANGPQQLNEDILARTRENRIRADQTSEG